ncbi:hypothetical protein I7I50_07785 [Histoplasma capsulatum G186AR]|uniref:Uncharacterized protein n=1 Tax=Ajellomyces capsulatus TaxID=5037 RepID=A0A8H7YXP8_AJECA|nr:hypothetical protein I7I52_09142 [Histoplasma capsulatum]QSS68389.1 hypothetical protein I7I50_07785 [Histoplasma capsulatum G186AR]
MAAQYPINIYENKHHHLAAHLADSLAANLSIYLLTFLIEWYLPMVYIDGDISMIYLDDG